MMNSALAAENFLPNLLPIRDRQRVSPRPGRGDQGCGGGEASVDPYPQRFDTGTAAGGDQVRAERANPVNEIFDLIEADVGNGTAMGRQLGLDVEDL